MVAASASVLRGEEQPAQAAAELRQVDALARRGQQHLADHLVDVRRIGARAPGAEAVDAKREGVVVGHRSTVPATFAWVAAIMHRPLHGAVGRGQHSPTLSAVSAGPVGGLLRDAVTIHCT